MKTQPVAQVSIDKVFHDHTDRVTDFVIKEIPLTIYVDDIEIATLLATPTDLSDLAVGFLYSTGIITEYKQIERISFDEKRWMINLKLSDGQFNVDTVFRRICTSGCGRGTHIYRAADHLHRSQNTSNLKLSRDHIYHLMADFQSMSSVFKETGGVHSAALTSAEEFLVFREDIGRHNAVDKILGCALANSIDLHNKVILISGRVSSEIILKIQKTPIGIIVSRSAPTDQAIRHADECNLTLVGFARGRRMNVYCGLSRII